MKWERTHVGHQIKALLLCVIIYCYHKFPNSQLDQRSQIAILLFTSDLIIISIRREQKGTKNPKWGTMECIRT